MALAVTAEHNGAALILLAVVAHVFGTVMAANAQPSMDFSGRWVLTSSGAGSDAPQTMKIEQWMTSLNAYGEPISPGHLRISTEHSAPDGQTTHVREIFGDQKLIVAASTADPAGWHGDYATKWDAGTLTITDRRYTGRSPRTGAWTERREAWSIAPDGTLVIEIITEGSKSTRRKVTCLYKRQ
jgi:hypothetical protein